ncbi:MAG: ATP-dependent DNA helicase RecQ [Cytophagales bacterium]|nr:MAG: ATP-dependent DNA helicase RecQ [Cytophagales bacterium]
MSAKTYPLYSLLFIPLAVARVQKTLLEFLLAHPELFRKEKIEIAIIERDLPCGAIAVESLQELFVNLNALLNDSDRLPLPEISLTVFETPKWVFKPGLHRNARMQDENFFNQHTFDIILDHSILRRSKVYEETDFRHDNSVKIRSSHYVDTAFGTARRVYCADLLRYKTLVERKGDGSYVPIPQYEGHINFFIQNIFRKVSFREGQLPIISRALQQKPVIGLLPTGGGKSLTFQLPAFLQPGLCVVVDPIKSLMEDQVRVLKQNWIDCCDYINSNLEREEKRRKLIDFRYGETMFLFISPERFVMDDFRTIVQTIDASAFGLAFSYCVIDEVHCVSEWGHDFRSTYLMLGKNAQRFAKTRSENPVSLIGLTATASFDVLADIERELQIQHDDLANAIIMIENTIRPELFFRVLDVTQENRLSALNHDFSRLGSNLQKLNNTALIEKSQQHHLSEFNDVEQFNPHLLYKDSVGEPIDLSQKSKNDFCAIVFCPVRGQRGHKSGVDFVHERLDSESRGFFYSSDTDSGTQEVVKHFENFTSDRTKHMVCTKAFGMGIDKKDIRATYHYVYSSSLESLVQEAGRAGRDKKIAEATILVSQSSYVKVDVHKFFSENKDLSLLQNKFTRKAIRQTFEKKWDENAGKSMNISFSTLNDVIVKIDLIDFSLLSGRGNKYNILPETEIVELRNKLKEKEENNQYRYFSEKYYDRDIHDFFHEISFKGVDTEKSQFLNLFKVREFQFVNKEKIYLDGQDTLVNTFDSCQDEMFRFTITATKSHLRLLFKLCQVRV